MLFSASVAYLDRSFTSTEFVTDLAGLEIADALKWEFTSYSCGVERKIPAHARHVWMLPKLYAQALQSQPHAHIDLDLMVYHPFPKRIREARVAAQSKDTPGYYFDSYVQNYLSACGIPLDTVAYNMAITLWNDLALRDEFCEAAIKLACDKASSLDNGVVLSITCEQAFFGHFMRQRRIKVEEAVGIPTLIEHGETRDAQFTHYWGRSKQMLGWLKKCEERFAEDFPGKHALFVRGWKKLLGNRRLKQMGVIKDA
jgi:hypothetical protein